MSFDLENKTRKKPMYTPIETRGQITNRQITHSLLTVDSGNTSGFAFDEVKRQRKIAFLIIQRKTFV